MLRINEDDSILQKQIKKRLNARRWSCRDLAKEAKMPESTVRDIVLRGREPYAYNLRSIADALGATMEELTEEDKDYQTKAFVMEKTVSMLKTLSKPQAEKALSYVMFLRQGGDT